ncbi:hypothetical protein [Tautonia plasticadhaerens]|uniref:Uncharacterized protein n=1 Tax=Tautonia plasticadhaerens TaxID=2527974 RepID=A0A518H4E6_9BACT|nr:hypothetical protein [Tautonia plasticadhaerens]QDV35697.1 hypothetical protein ElP_36020 [Tautonia plasticadhaerens]
MAQLKKMDQAVEVEDEEVAFLTGWQPMTGITGKDVDESVRVNRLIGAVPGQCWFNARRVVQGLVGYADASYVEGIAVLNGGQLLEHGWVCRPDGMVIDPTLPTAGGAYYPGLEFRGRPGIEAFLGTPEGRRCKRSPFYYAFGWGGRDSPGMRRAWEQSRDHLRALFPAAFEADV